MLPNLSTLSLSDLSALAHSFGAPKRQGPQLLNTLQKKARQDLLWAGILSPEYPELIDEIRKRVRFLSSEFGPKYSYCPLIRKDTDSSRWRRRAALVKEAVDNVAKQPFVPQFEREAETKIDVLLSEETVHAIATQYFAAVDRNETAISMTTFEREALKALFSLRDDDGTIRIADIKLSLQYVDHAAYNPINDQTHMDYTALNYKSGTTYGEMRSDHEDNILVVSFCVDRDPSGDNPLVVRNCGTVVYEGLPVADPQAINDAAVKLSLDPVFQDTCTEFELGHIVSIQFHNATSTVLGSYTEEQLEQLGIKGRQIPSLVWSNANGRSFHRSPRRDEVLQSITHDASGTPWQSMRCFGAVIATDMSVNSALGSNNQEKKTIKTPNGYELTVVTTLNLDTAASGGVMGEDRD